MLVQMLFANADAVKCAAPPVRKGRSQAQIDNIYLAHEGQTRKAIARYKAAMAGKGWMTTTRVEMAIGCAATVANPFLNKLLSELKLIERRPRGGKPYNRKSGWEWCWIEEKR